MLRGIAQVANGRRVLKRLGAIPALVANVETIIAQGQSSFVAGDTIIVKVAFSKSGATDAATLNVRMGALGTTGDTAILSMSAANASTRTGGYEFVFKLTSATNALKCGNAATQTSAFVGVSTTTEPAGVAITDVTTAAMWVTLSMASAGATDTIKVQLAEIEQQTSL